MLREKPMSLVPRTRKTPTKQCVALPGVFVAFRATGVVGIPKSVKKTDSGDPCIAGKPYKCTRLLEMLPKNQ
jgi:hypothetical protein